MKQLGLIQTELNAPKSQYNKFGNYAYRSCEDILQALKPLLSKYCCSLVMRDEIKLIGDRYYVEAEVTLYASDGTSISARALARESEQKKGMDASQITGSTSSYARKYALNGLFAIDDNKDADTNEIHNQSKTTPNNAPRPKTISVGKFKGMSFDQVDYNELISYCKELAAEEDIKSDFKAFLSDARAYVAGR